MSVITTVFLPILLIGSIFIIIVLYKAFYKHNMNQALAGEATTGLIDLGSLIKTLSIIALLIMNIVTLTRITDLSNQMRNIESNLVNQISYLRSQLSYVSSDIDQYFAEQDLIQNKHYEVSGIDFENNVFTYDLEFTLLEKETDALVYLVIEKDGISQNTLLNSSSLTFSHSLDLEKDELNYTVSVLVEGDTIIQKELFRINVEDDESNIIQPRIDFGHSEEEEFLIAYVSVGIFNIDDLSVDSVVIELYNAGSLTTSQSLQSPTNITELFAPYQDEFTFYELQDGSYFAAIFDFDTTTDITVQFIITLSDGTVIIKIESP